MTITASRAVEKIDMALYRRAIVACDLIADAGRGAWTPGVELADYHARRGVELWCVEREGALWLVLPGTNSLRDALRDLAGQIPWRWARAAVAATADAAAATEAEVKGQVPVEGKSGRWWALGFLRAADIVFDRLDATGIRPAMTAGHSMGAATASILRWSRDVGETHALAPPRVRFGDELEPRCPHVHCWVPPDDLVTRLPVGARHIGVERVLPRIDRIGQEHTANWYRERLAREIARLEGPAKAPAEPQDALSASPGSPAPPEPVSSPHGAGRPLPGASS